jgi:seryl-tRNA synthetase
MHDIKAIRDNPQAFDSGLRSRGLDPQSAALIALDDRRRASVADLQAMQERRNVASKEIGAAMGRKDMAAAEALKAEVAALKDRMAAAETEQREAEAALKAALETIPNTPAPETPVGADEHGNVEYRSHGARPTANHLGAQHFEIGEAMGLMDFEAAARMSGSRFTVLKGGLARLERAIGQFMLDLQTQPEVGGLHGYTEVSPPLLVKGHAVYGVGQLPKFEEDLFRTTNDFYLTSTAEVTLTNLVREQIIAEEQLPLRFTALTPCFRSEAGAAGRDTRGMLRQHQFMKCELVSITTPETSGEEHERMLACAEAVLKKLELHYRVMTLCTGDMGFGSRKTYDIEVWLPGQGTYREISSCSNCGDFQARRMEARCRAAGEKGARYVHTLNGSGLAVGRTLIALLENYLNPDGSVTVPEALRPYMGGAARIEGAR